MKAEILKYSEYKIAHALWIQTQVKERTNIGFNTDQLCLELYSEYLKICGVKNSKASIFSQQRNNHAHSL